MVAEAAAGAEVMKAAYPQTRLAPHSSRKSTPTGRRCRCGQSVRLGFHLRDQRAESRGELGMPPSLLPLPPPPSKPPPVPPPPPHTPPRHFQSPCFALEQWNAKRSSRRPQYGICTEFPVHYKVQFIKSLLKVSNCRTSVCS